GVLFSVYVVACHCFVLVFCFFFSSRRRHTRFSRDWSSDVCSSDLKSGVHATLAGVIVGFFIPLKEKHGRSPAKRLEHVLHPWVAYMILPLFAFANAGVSLQGVTIDGLTSILPLGIIAGLLIGKPLGISLFCWLALRLKMAQLPQV